MALQVNYELNGDLYPGAYIKVQKIICTSTMVEEWYEDKGNQILKFVKIPEHTAQIFVYPDKEARDNNARPLHYFGIEFDYDVNSNANIYTVAYEALKNVKKIASENYLNV